MFTTWSGAILQPGRWALHKSFGVCARRGLYTLHWQENGRKIWRDRRHYTTYHSITSELCAVPGQPRTNHFIHIVSLIC
jgi:hypothetical protein